MIDLSPFNLAGGYYPIFTLQVGRKKKYALSFPRNPKLSITCIELMAFGGLRKFNHLPKALPIMMSNTLAFVQWLLEIQGHFQSQTKCLV